MNISGSDRSIAPASFQAVPDVKDETIGRFAAGRFRKTFRSLRPLLDDLPFTALADSGEETFRRARLSQSELDDEAHAFALTLVERWIADPSNVRLLRVALDLWPSVQMLDDVLKLFEPYLAGKIRNSSNRRIAYYCLAEILRAGATETGFVDDPESLPSGVNLAKYRRLLLQIAHRVVNGDAKAAPWYLMQQAILYIAVHDSISLRLPKFPKRNRSYWRLIAFLQGKHEKMSDHEFAILAVVSRRSFLEKNHAVELVGRSLTPGRFAEVASRDIEFGRDLFRAADGRLIVEPGIAEDMGIAEWSNAPGMQSLQAYVHHKGPLSPLRNEIGVLSFAKKFLEQVKHNKIPDVVTPSTVQIAVEPVSKYARVTQIVFRSAQKTKAYTSIYAAPSWAPKKQHWRFQLGYLLRFILTTRVDFSLPVRPTSWKETEPIYQPTRGHWFQRQYGFYVSATSVTYAARLAFSAKFQGINSSVRLRGWPSRMACRVAVR